MPSITDAPATTATPTSAATTTTVDPTIFDPNRVGDPLELSSFLLTIDLLQTTNGSVTKNTETIGYVKDPFSTSWLRDFGGDGSIDSRAYSIDGRYYDVYDDWYLYERGSPATPSGISYSLSTLMLATGAVVSANFVGEEEIGGVAVYHFTFDETNLSYYDPSVPPDPSNTFTLEGDFYLSQVGHYVLYAHSNSTTLGEGGFESTREITETLSLINQLPEITLPTDMLPMSEALDFGADFVALLPPGSSLSTMKRYGGYQGSGALGIDYYTYFTPVRTNDEFIQFYTTLQPTNGWTVSHIGHISTHLHEVNCETLVECVLLKNGSEQVVLSFNGGIIAEFDHRDVFGPLSAAAPLSVTIAETAVLYVW